MGKHIICPQKIYGLIFFGIMTFTENLYNKYLGWNLFTEMSIFSESQKCIEGIYNRTEIVKIVL